MCRGVQHPIRGLFLRSYLAQISRDKLPDIGSEYEGLSVRAEAYHDWRPKASSFHDSSSYFFCFEDMLSVLQLVRQLQNQEGDVAGEDDPATPKKNFQILNQVIESQGDMPIVGAITLYVSLLTFTFTLRVHPDRLDYVDQVLGSCVKKLSNKPKLEDSRATKQVVALLSAPLEKYSDIVTSLTLSNYPRVMDHLDNGTNKIMAMVIIQSIMTNQACVSSADKVEVLFELIKGLIKDLEGDSEDELDEEDFNEEQNSVARVIHVLYNDDPEEMLKIIGTVRKHIMTGGPKRLPFTIPPLVFSALRLVRRLQNQEGDVAGEDDPATPKKIFQILNQTIEALSYVPAPELALRLYLQCAE
nr:vacuolar protein sorting-associated protein 35B-like isoform X2 [Tanacetum cinerariifolium]